MQQYRPGTAADTYHDISDDLQVKANMKSLLYKPTATAAKPTPTKSNFIQRRGTANKQKS